MGSIFKKTMTKQEEIIKQITNIVDSYERMLKEVLINKGERFDSAPYTLALQALNKMLEEEQK